VVKGKFVFRISFVYSDGPAIWVNDKLDKGQTNKCATFNSDMLTLGQKDKDEQFDIHNFELFIL
jgi:hypothetical protein